MNTVTRQIAFVPGFFMDLLGVNLRLSVTCCQIYMKPPVLCLIAVVMFARLTLLPYDLDLIYPLWSRV